MEANTLDVKPLFTQTTLHHIPIGGRHPTAAKHIYIHDAGMTCSSDFPGGKRSVVSCSKALEEVVSHSSLVELNFF